MSNENISESMRELIEKQSKLIDTQEENNKLLQDVLKAMKMREEYNKIPSPNFDTMGTGGISNMVSSFNPSGFGGFSPFKPMFKPFMISGGGLVEMNEDTMPIVDLVPKINIQEEEVIDKEFESEVIVTENKEMTKVELTDKELDEEIENAIDDNDQSYKQPIEKFFDEHKECGNDSCAYVKTIINSCKKEDQRPISEISDRKRCIENGYGIYKFLNWGFGNFVGNGNYMRIVHSSLDPSWGTVFVTRNSVVDNTLESNVVFYRQRIYNLVLPHLPFYFEIKDKEGVSYMHMVDLGHYFKFNNCAVQQFRLDKDFDMDFQGNLRVYVLIKKHWELVYVMPNLYICDYKHRKRKDVKEKLKDVNVRPVFFKYDKVDNLTDWGSYQNFLEKKKGDLRLPRSLKRKRSQVLERSNKRNLKVHGPYILLLDSNNAFQLVFNVAEWKYDHEAEITEILVQDVADRRLYVNMEIDGQITSTTLPVKFRVLTKKCVLSLDKKNEIDKASLKYMLRYRA